MYVKCFIMVIIRLQKEWILDARTAHGM